MGDTCSQTTLLPPTLETPYNCLLTLDSLVPYVSPQIALSCVMSSAHSSSMPTPNLSSLAHPSMSFAPFQPPCRAEALLLPPLPQILMLLAPTPAQQTIAATISLSKPTHPPPFSQHLPLLPCPLADLSPELGYPVKSHSNALCSFPILTCVLTPWRMLRKPHLRHLCHLPWARSL